MDLHMPNEGERPEERIAAIEASLPDSEEGLPLLDAHEQAILIDAFFRAREQSQSPFTEVEYIGVIMWAQYTRMDAHLLELLRHGLLGIDVSGPEVVFAAPPDTASFSAASAFVSDTDDADIHSALLSFAALRWAEGHLPKPDELARVAEWVKTARSKISLLEGFLAEPGAMIDYDARGRIVIYPPENT